MPKVSFDHPFKLTSIRPGPGYRLILGDAVLMEDDEPYEMMEENLADGWDEHMEKSIGKLYRIGEHVLVKSEGLGGFKRGIIQDQMECVPGTGQYIYNVFLFDYGVFEDVDGASVVSLSLLEDWKKNLLPPRAVIVRPVRLSKAPLVMKENHAEGPTVALFLETLPMTKKSKQLATTWLSEGVHSLRIKLVLDNHDFNVLGDVVRHTFNDEPTSSKDGMQLKEESFGDWLVDMNFAKYKTSMGDDSGVDEVISKLKNAAVQESVIDLVNEALEKDVAESSDEDDDELFYDKDPYANIEERSEIAKKISEQFNALFE